MTHTSPDLEFSGAGSVYLLHACTDAGRDWIAEHIPEDTQTLGSAVAVEWRYVDDIANGAMADGLVVA